MARRWIGVLVSVALMVGRSAVAEPVVHARIDRDIAEYKVNADLTYTRTETIDETLYTVRALRHLDRADETFYPDKQDLEVVEAWVDQPDGNRIQVEPTSIFTRPSAASQSTPGFVDSLTTTVLFPRLKFGSRTHVVWRFTQKVPALLGFTASNMNIFSWDTGRDETRIEIPAGVPLQWRARGGFVVQDTTKDGIRHIDAYIEDTHAREEEPSSVSRFDYMPEFIATTVPNAETIGAVVYRVSESRSAVTPEIAALAARIAGDRVGLDAARAIHAWVAANIRYVAVYLSPEEGYVPHPAAEVLKAGYGDCKDYVALMQALLAARGIEGQMAVLDWGTSYADPLIWNPYFANHAILYLPAYDHYLNPTDRQAGFDALDRELSGKVVVIMTKEGRVARTPPATPEANRYRYTAHVTLGQDGAIEGDARFEMAPNMEAAVRSALSASSSLKDLAQRMLTNTPEGGFGEFETSDPLDLSRPLSLAANWHSPMAVNVQGSETFLRVPTGLDVYPAIRERAKLSPTGKRATAELADATDSAWETTVALPPGMGVARLPPDIDLTTPVGHYIARYRTDHGAVVAWRNLVISTQIVPADQYPELEKLIYATLVDLRATIVLTHAAQ